MDYKIYSCWYGSTFELLAAAWRASVQEHCPEADVVCEKIDYAPRVHHVRDSGPCNLAKVARWREVLLDSDKPVLFMDVDTYARRPLAPIWDYDFDVAYCWRPGGRPIIGGVVAARPTPEACAFLTIWVANMAGVMMKPVSAWDRMAVDGGLSQTVMARLSEDPPAGVRLTLLDPYTWNACDEVWSDVNDGTRIVHCKGDLREDVLLGRRDGPHPELVKEWRRYMMDGITDETFKRAAPTR